MILSYLTGKWTRLLYLVVALLLGLAGHSQAQVYYLTSDGSPTTNTTADALSRMNFDGTGMTSLVSSIATIPNLLALDPAGNRAFVYEGLTAIRGIKVYNNLSTTPTLGITLPVPAQVMAIEYDAASDYVYFVTTDGVAATASANDALCRIKSDGTGFQTLLSSFTTSPVHLALNTAANRAYVYEALTASRGIKTIDLSTNTVIGSTIAVPAAVSALDYSQSNGYLYYLTTDGAGGTTSATDAIYRTLPDGSNNAAVITSITGSPAYLALDLNNNRIYVADNFTATRGFRVVTTTNGTSGTVTASYAQASQFTAVEIGQSLPPTTVTSITTATTSPTNATSISYTVTFGASVTGVSTSNFLLSPTVAGASIASVSGSGTTYTVVVNTGTGSGTLTLSLANDTGISPSISNEPFAVPAITIDKTAPTVSSVGVQANGTYRTGQALSFTVNFSEAVTVVGTPQLGLTIGATSRLANYASGSGTTALVFSYSVQAGDADADGIAVGTLGLNGGTIRDAATNNATLTLSGVGATTGVLVDGIAPVVSSINRQTPAAATTNATSLTFRVTFSESVTGVDANDFTFITTSGSVTSGSKTVATVTAGSVYDVTVSGVSGNGNVRLDLNSSGTSITDTPAGNALSGGFTGGQTYTINQNVTVVSVTRLDPSPTATAQVRYQVVFSGSVANLTPGNFTPTVTSGSISGASVFSVSTVSGTTYTVTVTTGSTTSNGTLRLDVATSTGTTPAITNVPYTTGEEYTITKSFAAAPTLRIQAAGSASGNGDVTAFVDVVQVLQSGTSTVVATGLQNGSFETSNVPAGGFKKTADGVIATPWSFTGTAGVSRNNSDFGSTAASGDAVGVVQSTGGSNGSVSQNLAVPTGSYQVSFQAIQRNYSSLDQRLNVFLNNGIDDVFVGNIQPNNTPTYGTFTSAAFSVFAPALTATVSSPAAASGGTTNTTPIPFSVSFSQSVGTSFTDTDVTVSNGTITAGSFSGSGAGPYTFTVTPTTFGSATTVSLAAGVAQDGNNTLSTASNAYSVTYNQPTTPTPVVTIPSNGATTNSTPTSLGSAVVGSTVRVYIDGNQVGAAITPNSSGTWIRTYSGLPALTSGTHTVYATAQLPGYQVSAPSPTNTFTTQVPAAYSSSAAAQPTTARVVAGSTSQEILRVAIVIGGGPDAPISATSFTFTTTGSTSPADITAARVYYTGTSSTFATTNQFGSAFANPNGTFTIGGSRQLVIGTNYFFLVYDVAATATNGNVLDATAPSFTLFDGSFPSTRNPSDPAPAGSRTIVRSTRVAGTALRLSGDATPGYVDFSASTNPAVLLNTGAGGAYSQVAWIKPAIGTGSDTYYVLGNGTGNSAAPCIYVTGNGRLGAGFGTGADAFSTQTGPNTITANEWHYVGATYTGATLTIFLDGENVGSVSASGTPAATRVNFVGNIAASASNNFPGDIDEVSQWNRALGQIELRRMRHLTLTGTELNLVSYMQFNDAGPTTLDVITNAVGTLTGAMRVTSTAPVSSGTANLQVVAANTTYNFPGTSVSMAFTGVTGSSETVVFRLEGKALGTQPAATGLVTTYTPAYWIVDKYTGGTFTSANVTYTLTAADISATDAATPSNLKLFKRGSNAEGAFDAPISATAANATTGTVTFPVTSFSQTVIGTFGSSPLPVELVSFTAEQAGSVALLRWTTASEKNSDHFAVEVSPDGTHFRPVGTVAGQGTTTRRTDYQFQDQYLLSYGAKLVYYRLRQVDYDGTASYSPVRVVAPATETRLALFPNPTTGGAVLTGTSPGTTVQVYDALGRLVLTATADAAGNTALLLPPSFPRGVYIVRSGATALRLSVR